MFSRVAATSTTSLQLRATSSRWAQAAVGNLKRNRGDATIKSGVYNSVRCFSSRQSPTRKKFLEQKATRKIPNEASSSSQSQQKANKTKLLAVGANTVLFFGMSMWLLLFVDQYFQKREKEIIAKAQERLFREFGDLDQMAATYKDHPVLFSCVVRLKSRELHDMFPVHVGDVVDVLVEGVGNDQSLNICRSRPKHPEEAPIVALYPIGCLQRLRPVESEESPNSSA